MNVKNIVSDRLEIPAIGEGMIHKAVPYKSPEAMRSVAPDIVYSGLAGFMLGVSVVCADGVFGVLAGRNRGQDHHSRKLVQKAGLGLAAYGIYTIVEGITLARGANVIGKAVADGRAEIIPDIAEVSTRGF